MDEELRLAKALPWEVRNRTERHGHSQMLKVHKSAHEGTQIVFAAIGLAGISSHGVGWWVVVHRYWVRNAKQLRLHLIVSENRRQWYGNMMLWSQHDWRRP